MKNFLRILIVLVSAILIVGLILMATLFITNYNPKETELASYTLKGTRQAKFNEPMTFFTWNIGYGISSSDEKSFSDGGKKVEPINYEVVRENLIGIRDTIKYYDADGYFLQNVDENSKRSGKINEVKYLSDELNLDYTFAYDHKVSFFPFPWPVQGKIASGSATFTPFQINGAHRVPLTPTSSYFPINLVSPKRAMLVTRIPIANSAKSLVLVNINLDNKVGVNSDVQFNEVVSFLNEEYKKGNYIVAGGSINRLLNGNIGSLINDNNLPLPERLRNTLSDGWKLSYDSSTPTVRTLNDEYKYWSNSTTNQYVVDGFITSPNVDVIGVHTIDEGFFYSNHNPVRATVRLLEE